MISGPPKLVLLNSLAMLLLLGDRIGRTASGREVFALQNALLVLCEVNGAPAWQLVPRTATTYPNAVMAEGITKEAAELIKGGALVELGMIMLDEGQICADVA